MFVGNPLWSTWKVLTWVNSSLTQKYYTRLEKLAKDKPLCVDGGSEGGGGWSGVDVNAKRCLRKSKTDYLRVVSEAIFQQKVQNVKLNISDVCNLISVSSEHFN